MIRILLPHIICFLINKIISINNIMTKNYYYTIKYIGEMVEI